MSIEFVRWWPILGLVAVPFIWRLSQRSTLGSSLRHMAGDTIVRIDRRFRFGVGRPEVIGLVAFHAGGPVVLDPLGLGYFAVWVVTREAVQGSPTFRVAAALAEASSGRLIAIDGKTIRRSFDKADSRAAIHMVSAWCETNHVNRILCHVRSASDSVVSFCSYYVRVALCVVCG